MCKLAILTVRVFSEENISVKKFEKCFPNLWVTVAVLNIQKQHFISPKTKTTFIIQCLEKLEVAFHSRKLGYATYFL